MILVGQFDSPFVRRVAVTLLHYGMPFTRNPLSIFSDTAKVQKINPLIRVPSLILESGEVLVDSSAIVDHLDEMAGPARALIPPHGADRRKILQVAYLSAGVSEKIVLLFLERLFHDEKAISKKYEKRLLSQVTATLAELEHRCGSPWFFDMHMSHADIMTGCMIGHMKLRFPALFSPDKYPKLHALSAHCEMRDEFVQARPSPEETVPSHS